MDRGIHTSFTKQSTLLWKLTDDGIQQTVGSATWYDGLCYLDGHAEKGAIACVAEKPKDTLINWHARLGHVNYDDVALMENYGLADGVHISDKSRNTYGACREGKKARSRKAQTDTSRSAPTYEMGAVLGVDIKRLVSSHKTTTRIHIRCT